MAQKEEGVFSCLQNLAPIETPGLRNILFHCGITLKVICLNYYLCCFVWHAQGPTVSSKCGSIDESALGFICNKDILPPPASSMVLILDKRDRQELKAFGKLHPSGLNESVHKL